MYTLIKIGVAAYIKLSRSYQQQQIVLRNISSQEEKMVIFFVRQDLKVINDPEGLHSGGELVKD